MARPTKEAALTRDLGRALSRLDEAAAKSLPKLIKKLEKAMNDPDIRIETLFQMIKFLTSHAEKAHEERLDLEKTKKEDANKKEVDSTSFLSLTAPTKDKTVN